MGVFKKLPVSVLLGKPIKNRLMKGIFLPGRKNFPFHSKPVTIIASFDGTTNAVTDGKANETDEGQSTVLFGVVRQTGMVLMVEIPMLGKMSESGLMKIEGHPSLSKKRIESTASGIMEVESGQSFYVLFTNVRET